MYIYIYIHMGAGLLLSVPRKTICSHHEKNKSVATTTDDNDGRQRRTTHDDGQRRFSLNSINFYRFLMICGIPGDP